jgi:hypothetical protein
MKPAIADFTTAAQPNAAFGSCYGVRCSTIGSRKPCIEFTPVGANSLQPPSPTPVLRKALIPFDFFNPVKAV